MANGKQLLLLCTRALSSFDNKLLGVDEHLQNFLSLKECSVSILILNEREFSVARNSTYLRLRATLIQKSVFHIFSVFVDFEVSLC